MLVPTPSAQTAAPLAGQALPTNSSPQKMPGSIFSTDTGPACARNVKREAPETPDKPQTWVIGAVWIRARRFYVITKSGREKGGKKKPLSIIIKKTSPHKKKAPDKSK